MKAKSSANKKSRLADIMAVLILAIIAILPFHALLTTWAGSNFGYIDLFRIWKEILLLFLLVGGVIILVKYPKTKAEILQSKFALLAILYLIITLLRSLGGLSENNINLSALAYGLIANLRYIVFFFIAWITAKHSKLLMEYWLRVVITPAIIVVIFGVMQKFLLDQNFLSHFGYGPGTITSYSSVDNKDEYIRVQSTLRGPNPLGAYLSFIVVLLASSLLKVTKDKNKIPIILLVLLSSIAIFFTFSRSAWLGLLVSLLLLVAINLKDYQQRKKMFLSVFASLMVFASLVIVFRNNDYVQNTFFHSDETSLSKTSSNQDRYNGIYNGLKDVYNHPLGQGPGSAGPASARNDKPAKIAENYYIQIAQEVGIVGLFTLLAFHLLAGVELYKRRNHLLGLVLFCSLVGISAINLLSHAWMDDTLSMMWWGLAGIAIAQPVIISHKQHEKIQNKV